MRTKILAFSLGLACLLPIGATLAQQAISASVGFYAGALVSLPALVASDRKLFDQVGLTVELVPIATGPAMTSAVASGSVTFVNNSWDNLMVAVEQGLPVRGVAGSTIKMPFAFVARKGLELPNLKAGYPAVIKDLVGKNWGVLALGVSVEYIEQRFLIDAGYKPNDVTFLAVGGPSTARPALERGTVDTYLSVEPLPTIIAAKKEGTVILDLAENQGPEVYRDLGYNGWWASTTTIKDKPEVVARFSKAMDLAYCWYRKPENFDQLVVTMQQFVKIPELSDDEYRAMIKRILPMYGPYITTRTIDAWSKLMIEQKLLKAPKSRADVLAASVSESTTCAN